MQEQGIATHSLLLEDWDRRFKAKYCSLPDYFPDTHTMQKWDEKFGQRFDANIHDNFQISRFSCGAAQGSACVIVYYDDC